MTKIQYRVQPDTLILTNAITTPHGDVYITYEEDGDAEDQRPYYEVDEHTLEDRWLFFESGLERVSTAVWFHIEDILEVINEDGTIFRVSLDAEDEDNDFLLPLGTEVVLLSNALIRGASVWYQIENPSPTTVVTNEDGTVLRISTDDEDEDDVELAVEDVLAITGAVVVTEGEEEDEEIEWWPVTYDGGDDPVDGFVLVSDTSAVFFTGYVNGADIAEG